MFHEDSLCRMRQDAVSTDTPMLMHVDKVYPPQAGFQPHSGWAVIKQKTPAYGPVALVAEAFGRLEALRRYTSPDGQASHSKKGDRARDPFAPANPRWENQPYPSNQHSDYNGGSLRNVVHTLVGSNTWSTLKPKSRTTCQL